MTIHIFGEAMLEYHGSGASAGLRYGGDTLNTAIHLARLGHEVRYVTALGTDPISDALLASWEKEGIDTRFVLRHPQRHPGIYAIHLDERGERSFLYWRDRSAAREMFALAGMEEAIEAASGGSLLYYSLITLAILPANAREKLRALAQRVSQHGGLVAYDSNFRPSLWPDRITAAHESSLSVAAADIGLPTGTDEAWLMGEPVDERRVAQRWSRLGCGEVIVKSSERGCFCQTDGGAVEHIEVTPIEMIDSSGAGDAFNAGYLARRLAGCGVHESIDAGHRLAAWVIRRPGALPECDDQAPYGDL